MAGVGVSTAAPLAPADLTTTDQESLGRRAAFGSDLSVLSKIYQPDVNLSVWNREIDAELKGEAEALIASDPNFQKSLGMRADEAPAALQSFFPKQQYDALRADMAWLIDVFSYLFDLRDVGLRLAVLDSAMCPKFHVDKVPCRLITTYTGATTEWLPHDRVNRRFLGANVPSIVGSEPGICESDDIEILETGAVALLKGESWEGNEGCGLVHRSPNIADGSKRLLLTIDFGG
jgi:hypothetical protein